MEKRRVVVTGLCIVSPLGIGLEENWDAVSNGRSGIGPITRFDPKEVNAKIAGEVKNLNPEDYIEKKEIIVETSMAKFWTTEMLNRVANRSLDLCGNFGTLEKCRIVRAWRDAKIMTIFAGTNEVMKNIAAKFMGL